MRVKKIYSSLTFLTLFFVGLLLVSCEKEEVVPSASDLLIVNREGNTSIQAKELCYRLDAIPIQSLEPSEISSLGFMREEEKLAHDVYVFLYEKYEFRTFLNISKSEATHYEAVGTLLERYGLADPSAGKALGEFENETLQNLFDDLTERGSTSLEEALKVGALIEEVDIRDIDHDLQMNINNTDIELVYNNLMKGSRNHLRAFVRSLKMQGVGYEPEILTYDVYSSIINSSMEQGNVGQ